MKIKTTGIVSYGAYLPSQKILGSEIATAQGKLDNSIPRSLGVAQKTVPEIDEDTITMSVQAGFQALSRLDPKDKEKIGTLFIGSESHPYAVKPSASVVKAALGLSERLAAADLQFACKAGTQALQICASYVAAGMTKLGMAIGADTAQARPGDVLEFTASAGAAALILGKDKLLARLLATHSITTDTPDFWRRPKQDFPEHAGRFTGEPGYFYHVRTATEQLLKETNLTPADIDWCVFHTPNAKFPKAAARQLGFSEQQLKYSLLVEEIGNTYAAASLLALINVLDHATAGQKILVTSYGSGSGADSFLFETTPLLVQQRKQWSALLAEQAQQTTAISYQETLKTTKH
ncbi:MAG: hydroxymethylglutaryl-CoA synthase [Candidatus Paceibacterota bacterium]